LTDVAIVGQDPRFGGGAWALMAAFWEAVVSLGHEPRLLYVEHPSLSGRTPRPPLDRRGIRPRFGHLDALNQLSGAKRLGPELDAAEATWVVATTAHYGAAAVRSGRPFCCWVATTLEDEWRPQLRLLPPSRRAARALNGPVLRALERRVLQRADAVYTISSSAREAVSRTASIPIERIGVIPLPVDTSLFRPSADSEYEAGVEAPTVVFVGRADDPRKNVGLLLEAWPAIASRHPDAQLRLIGTPPQRQLPASVEAVGEPDSIESELRRASLLVLPSVQEGFGLVAAEALAAGVPVVTTPSGGPEALVRESEGGVVLAGFTADELARTVSLLLDDGERLAHMRDRGRAYVERQHSLDRTRTVVSEALAKGPRFVR
jgi:glycosyltransferase involved in cell wall biosynthesis